jgi:hypothetical protein
MKKWSECMRRIIFKEIWKKKREWEESKFNNNKGREALL